MTDYTGMSDADLMAAVNPQPAQPPSYSNMSDADLLKLVGPQPPPASPKLNPLATGISKTGDWMGAAASAVGNAVGSIPIPDILGDATGDTSTDTPRDIGELTSNIGSTIGRAANTATDALRSPSQYVANAVDNPSNDQAMLDTRDIADNFSQNHPDYSASVLGGAKILGALGAAEGVSSVRRAISSATQPAADSFAASKVANTLARNNVLPDTQAIMEGRGISSEAVATMTPQQITKIKNQMYAEGVVGNIQDARTIKNGIYSMADEVGNDDTFNAANTKNQLDALHQKYSNDSAYDGTPLVRKLDSWRNMFDEDGSITPTRLNKLQDQVDDAFRENPKSPEGEVYGAIQTPVNGAVDAAKQQFPNWGKLIDIADDAHYNLMKSTRDDSTFTGKWSPDSQKDFQIVAGKSNNPADFMGDTQRQIANLANVKDEAELQKMMTVVPKDLQGQYLTDVQKNASTPLKLRNAIKSIISVMKGNPGASITNAMQSLPSTADIAGWDPDAATHITDRMQSYKDAASDAYQAHLDAKQAQAAAGASAQYSGANAQRLLPAPSYSNRPPVTPQQALPSPPDIRTNSVGTSATPGGASYTAPRGAVGENTSPVAGIGSPASGGVDMRGAQMRSGSELGQFAAQNGGQPIKPFENATSMGQVGSKIHDPEYDAAMDALQKLSRKRGGPIPTPAQIKKINGMAKRTREGRQVT